jgi:hypothetical protein
MSPSFWPNSTVLVPCFPEFTENTAKHPENWCSHVLIPRRKKFNWYLQRFSKSWFPMGKNRRAGHLCVGKPPILALRIRMKTLEGSHWKSENHPTLVSTCVCIRASPALLWKWPDEFVSPSKFSFGLFRNPAHKTKTGTANRCTTTDRKPRGPIIMMGQPFQ